MIRPLHLCTAWWMDKRALKQLSLHTIEIHATGFDCDNGCGSDSPTTADQDFPTKPDSAFLI